MNVLAETLLGAGRVTPSKIAVLTHDERSLSYSDLERVSAQLANALCQRHGVTKGDRVAVQVHKCPEVLALNIACVRVGAIYVPLNTGYTDREVIELLDDATPTLLVRREGLDHPTTRIDLAQLIDEASELSGEFRDADCDAGTPAAMLFTSGTTGRPKGAVLTHGNLAANCRALNETWAITGEDVLLHILPLFHTHGLFVGAYCVLSSGASMILLESSDTGAMVDHLTRATLFMGVPTHYARLAGEPSLTADVAASVRLFLSGSAPMLAATHREFMERTGRSIIERYGMTETGIITSNPIDGSHKVGTVGVALPGVAVRLDDEPVGGIEVRGSNVFSHYWNRPELGHSEFTSDGWFKTGDVGRRDPEGFLEIVGRAKDVIISGGLNVYPKEVERILNSSPDVLESSVVGLANDDLGEMVVAAVVARRGARIEPQALREYVRLSLAGYKVPKRIVIVEALPRNAMGKVLKAQLRRQLTSAAPSEESIR